MPKTHADGRVSNADILPAALGTVPDERTELPVIDIRTGNAEWDEYLTEAARKWLADTSARLLAEKQSWEISVEADATVTHGEVTASDDRNGSNDAGE